MPTFLNLRASIAQDLRDPSNKTFTDAVIGDMVNQALAEIGRIAPRKFQEDIDPIANQFEYQLQQAGVDIPVTGANATDLFTSATHGLTAGTAIRFTALTGGTGLSVGTTYYVIASGLTANDFKVSLTINGSAVNFTTDVTAGTFKRVGADDPIPEIEVYRVELWDETSTPHKPVKLVAPASEGYVNFSTTGWALREGILEVPYWLVRFIGTNVANYSIRVWGYAPYIPLLADDDQLPLSNEKEWALRAFCRVLALQRLTSERDLFTQWQTRSGNTDTSLAGLLGDRNSAMEDWRRLSRAITVLREAPG